MNDRDWPDKENPQDSGVSEIWIKYYKSFCL